MQEKEIAVVYMVAGIGSRFGKGIKQFAKVGPNNETLIELSINQAVRAGISKIIFIVGNLTEKPFKEKFRNSYKEVPIIYAAQKFDPEKRDKPWGTGDALLAAKPYIDCPFIICNGDDLYGEQTFKILINHILNQEKTGATIGYKLKQALSNSGAVNKGIFQLNPDNTIKSITEFQGITRENLKKRGLKEEDFCSHNIFALYPEILDSIEENVEKFKQEHKEDRKIECFLPTELNRLISERKLKLKCYSTPEKWINVTNRKDEAEVREKLKNKLDITTS